MPDGRDPLLHLWTGTGNELTGPAAAFSDAVYRKSTLPLREFEAARITVARVNQCRICLNLRPGTARTRPSTTRCWTAPQGPDRAGGAGRGVRPAVRDRPSRHGRRVLGAARLHAAFSDDELVQLGLCIGSWLAFGRLNQVFGVDEACRIPLDPHGPGRPERRAQAG